MIPENNFQTQSVDYLNQLIRSRFPYIWINTYEEKRLLTTIANEILTKQNKDLYIWSATSGLNNCTSSMMPIGPPIGEFKGTEDPTMCLNKIMSMQCPASKDGIIFIFRDFHIILSQPIPRKLRDIRDKLLAEKKIIIAVAPYLAHGPSGNKPGIEPTLEKEFTILDFELPTKAYIEHHLRSVVSASAGHASKKKTGINSNVQLSYSDDEYSKFASALQGLTEIEINQAVVLCLKELHRLDEKRLLKEKKQVIRRSDILEYIEQTPSLDEVGGLDEAKKYFTLYQDQFSPEAIAFGVEPLKGVILTGIPGSGKSLLAKAISAAWNMPLLRLDVGKVMAGLVGQSEQNMRAVIASAKSIAPAILWIDEIEKALSGTSSSSFSDGGTLSRVFGTLLTAMEEQMEGIVVIATANDISALPPELIRRFNEVLFVDLPVLEEREEILKIHLKKRKQNWENLKINTHKLAELCENYTGSEIEKAVKEGIVRAFQDNKRPLSTEDIAIAIKNTKTITQVMGEKIQAIRDWARNRARYASSYALKREQMEVTSQVTAEQAQITNITELDSLLD